MPSYHTVVAIELISEYKPSKDEVCGGLGRVGVCEILGTHMKSQEYVVINHKPCTLVSCLCVTTMRLEKHVVPPSERFNTTSHDY